MEQQYSDIQPAVSEAMRQASAFASLTQPSDTEGIQNTMLNITHVYTIIIYIYIWKGDCLGCVVSLCLVVCLTLLTSFFLPSLSLINMYVNV